MRLGWIAVRAIVIGRVNPFCWRSAEPSPMSAIRRKAVATMGSGPVLCRTSGREFRSRLHTMRLVRPESSV